MATILTVAAFPTSKSFQMNRRKFLGFIAAQAAAAVNPAMVQTVLGPVDVAQLGTVLMHEHVLVDFVGAEKVSASRYDAAEVFRAALPKLREVKQRGCTTLVECTPAYLGRDPVLLRRLAEAAGMHIITNTGYYCAGKGKFVPAQAFKQSAEQIAAVWMGEARDGIDGSGVRPGFQKLGVDGGPLSPLNAKLIAAGAICHKATGLRLHIHTGDGIAAREIVEILTKRSVTPSAYVWVHAQNEKDHRVHAELARAGVWIELDGIQAGSSAAHLAAVTALAGARLDGRLLLSQDSGWYRVGEPSGGAYKGYTYLFDHFLPALKSHGFGEAQIRRWLVENPAHALTPAV